MNSDKVKDNYKKSIQQKYGVDNPFQLDTVKNKIKQTNLERYGVDCVLKLDSTKEKAKSTSLQKYGTEYPSQSKEFQDKVKATNRKKYGCDYGLQSDVIKQKSIDTCLKKYGKEYYAQSHDFKNKFEDEEFVRNAKLKEYKTRKSKYSGNAFNSSNSEKLLLKCLSEKYPDLIYQYFDTNRYPFNCDFYIPSLDLFIEYHGSHFHGGKMFDCTDEKDLNKLNELIEKSEIKHQQSDKVNQYDMIIYTWTDLDVRKREYMIKNNLNFLIYYKLPTIEQLTTDIDKFKV